MQNTRSTQKIVVVGAGVAGLTTALLLSREARYDITVAAKHMPGDYDIEYASAWAGASVMPFSDKGTQAAKWEESTWPSLQDLATRYPESGIHFQEAEIYNRKKDNPLFSGELFSPDPWWRSLLPDFKEIPKSELKEGIANATSFTSVCINTTIYLPWLVSQCLKNGVIFKRAVFKHIADSALPGMHSSGQAVDMVVNCTGLGSQKLGGVEDKLLYPVRGQTVLVRNNSSKMYGVSGTDDGSEELTYIMTRAVGGGCILGGCYQKNNWESQHDPNLAIRIMKRCVEMCPELTGGRGIEHLDIIRHGVGLRPAREGGTRIEREKINGVWVVHNYGSSGSGFQTSYGCAAAAVALVDQVFAPKARL